MQRTLSAMGLHFAVWIQDEAAGWCCRRSRERYVTSNDPSRGSPPKGNAVSNGPLIEHRSTDKKVFLRRSADDHVGVDVPHLRIVDDTLWSRVRAREAWTRERYGAGEESARARGSPISGPSLRSSGGVSVSRKSKYPLSGLLKCHGCGASLVVSGADQRYVCASFTNGGTSACKNRTRIKRTDLEDRLLSGLATELGSPEYERLFEREARALLIAAGDHSHGGAERIRELEAKVANLVEALADGTMKASPARAGKLTELERALATAKQARVPTEFARILPRALERYRRLVRDLPASAARDPGRRAGRRLGRS